MNHVIYIASISRLAVRLLGQVVLLTCLMWSGILIADEIDQKTLDTLNREGIPIYPGSFYLAKEKTSYTMNFLSEDSVEKVLAFYRKALPAWKVKTNNTGPGDQKSYVVVNTEIKNGMRDVTISPFSGKFYKDYYGLLYGETFMTTTAKNMKTKIHITIRDF